MVRRFFAVASVAVLVLLAGCTGGGTKPADVKAQFDSIIQASGADGVGQASVGVNELSVDLVVKGAWQSWYIQDGKPVQGSGSAEGSPYFEPVKVSEFPIAALVDKYAALVSSCDGKAGVKIRTAVATKHWFGTGGCVADGKVSYSWMARDGKDFPIDLDTSTTAGMAQVIELVVSTMPNQKPGLIGLVNGNWNADAAEPVKGASKQCYPTNSYKAGVGISVGSCLSLPMGGVLDMSRVTPKKLVEQILAVAKTKGITDPAKITRVAIQGVNATNYQISVNMRGIDIVKY